MTAEVMVWGAVIASATFIVLIGTIVWRLASRLAASEARAELMQVRLDETSKRCDDVGKRLSDYKEQAAKEFVPHSRMTEVLEAIRDLGKRIDYALQPRGTATA